MRLLQKGREDAARKAMNSDETQSRRSVQRLVILLTDGIAAAEGAQVIMELYFSDRDRDPSNNDNYCRLMDWLKASRTLVTETALRI